MKSLAVELEFVLEFVLALGRDLGLSDRDLQTLSARSKQEGISFLTKTLPLLGKALERGLATGTFKLPCNFKKKFRDSEIPAFIGSFFGKIFRRDGTLLPRFCVYSVYVIRQLVYSVNKCDLPYDQKSCDALLQNFVDVEKEVDAYNRTDGFRLTDSAQLLICNTMAKDIFADFDPSLIRPKAGPGISSNIPFTRKYEFKVSNGFRSESGLGVHFFFNPDDALTRLERYPVYKNFDYFRSNLKARVILVPKDSRGPRIISAEPIENMFLQQGVMEYMVRKLESSPWTAGKVNFTDQSINQGLARLASMNQYWSTLDLKDASDRISLKLVTNIFRGSPIFETILETRTPITVLPDGREITLAKFAPMGSALCFPVLATCLWLLVVTYLATECGLPLHEAKDSVYVYGDDLIVPTAYAEGVSPFLEKFCLRVNKDKSFIGSVFAESCGYDSVLGNDVTPVRLRKCLVEKDTSSISSVVQTAHQLGKAGLHSSSEFLYSRVEKYIGRLPYGTSRSPYLCRYWHGLSDSVAEANYLKLPKRFKSKKDTNRYPHGVVLKAWTVEPIKQFDVESMYGRLMRTWGQIGKEDSSPLLPYGQFPRPRSTKLKLREFDHYAMA